MKNETENEINTDASAAGAAAADAASAAATVATTVKTVIKTKAAAEASVSISLLFSSCIFIFLLILSFPQPVLLTNDENTTRANSKTDTAKGRSCVFCGKTSMEAGVNCVNDRIFCEI